MRMLKFLMLINSTKFIRKFMKQYLKVNNMAQNKINNGGYYAHAQASNAYYFSLSQNSTKFIRRFMGQYLKGNNMEQIKSIMADVTRMRKFLMVIRNNIQYPVFYMLLRNYTVSSPLYERSWDSF